MSAFPWEGTILRLGVKTHDLAVVAVVRGLESNCVLDALRALVPKDKPYEVQIGKPLIEITVPIAVSAYGISDSKGVNPLTTHKKQQQHIRR